MSSIVVIYKSKYGATKSYAHWLKEQLHCDILENKHVKVEQLAQYDTVILGGGIYAGRIAGISFLSKNYDQLQNKKLLVFGVGASPIGEATLAELRKSNLSGNFGDLPLFYCRGRIEKEKLRFWDKKILSMVEKMAAKQDAGGQGASTAAIVNPDTTDTQSIDPRALLPLVEYLKANR